MIRKMKTNAMTILYTGIFTGLGGLAYLFDRITLCNIPLTLKQGSLRQFHYAHFALFIFALNFSCNTVLLALYYFTLILYISITEL